MNSAFRALSKGQIPTMTGNAERARPALGTARSVAASNTGRVTTNSAPASTLYASRLISWSRSRDGLAITPVWKRVGGPMGCPPTSSPWFSRLMTLVSPIESTSNTAVASGMSPRLRTSPVMPSRLRKPERVRAQQVGLDPQQVAIAARVLEQRLDSALLRHQDREGQGAQPCAAARAIRESSPRRHLGRCSSRAAASASAASCPRGGGTSTMVTKRPSDKRCARPDFSARGDRGLRVRLAGQRRPYLGATALRWRQAGRHRLQRQLNLPDVVGCGAATAADQTHSKRHEAPRVRGHVIGRAQVEIAALDVARLAGVGLGRQRRGDDLRHPLDRLEHRRRSHAAVQTRRRPPRARPGPVRTAPAGCRPGCSRLPRWSSAPRSAGRRPPGRRRSRRQSR